MFALLALSLLPGWPEVLENVDHLVRDGHFAHSDAHDQAAEEHAADGACADSDEHGCTPLAHRCACHVSLAALVPTTPDSVDTGWLNLTAYTLSPWLGGPLTRATPPPTRPPIALTT